MQTWTVDEMMGYGPCYERERLVELWAGRERLTAEDIIALPISAEHRVWALCTTGQHVRPAITRIVRRAVEAYALPHPATSAWARRWLDAEDRSLEAARAAWAAAEAEAPQNAALSAVAAWGAAWAASRVAAWAARAAWAAEKEEYDRQIEDFRAVLIG